MESTGFQPSAWCLLMPLLLAAAATAAMVPAPVVSVGPRFVVEPPSQVQFLNDTGAVIQCQANGTAPVRLWWAHTDGSPVTELPGLRQLRPNGDLVLLPFEPTALRQELHRTVYRCMASNLVGTVRSRDCVVRAVVPQPYTVQVFGEYAIAGNTGHLRCQIPAFVRRLVRVTGWLKADTTVVAASHHLHHQQQGTQSGSRFLLLNNGDLLIRNASRSDSGHYRCQTRHQLSQHTVLSQGQGHFVVNEVTSAVSPRIVSQSPVRVAVGHPVQLVCVAKAWPLATVGWFRVSESGLISPVEWSGNVQQHDGLVEIGHAEPSHAGNWICVANNTVGEERAYIELVVHRTDPPSVAMIPDRVRARLGSSLSFRCNVSHPVGTVLWLKDGQPLTTEGRVRLVQPHLLSIGQVTRQDAGCYQCVVHSALEPHDPDSEVLATSQAIGELTLADSPPQLLETFPAGMVVLPGQQISLRCAASGTQLPQIRWLLDQRSLDGYAPRRLTMADYVRSPGLLVSFVNITGAKVTDGGEYQCQASNAAGTVSYAARVNVLGPAALRTESAPITVVAGQTAVLRCPVVAYPIEWVQWQHRSATLPNSHRHQVESVVAGVGGQLTILNVHREHDQGEYSCTVKGSEGKSVRGSVQIEVRVAPLIDGQLIAPWTVANQGMKVKLMCSVLEGDPPLRIEWFREPDHSKPLGTEPGLGITVQQEEDYSLLTFRRVSSEHMANWTCRASNQVQSVNRTTYLQVNVAPSWRAEPHDAQVVIGHTLALVCQAEGHPTPRVIWKKAAPGPAGEIGDEPADRPTEYREIGSSYRRQLHPNGTLSVPEADKSDAGFYMCQVSNGIGPGLSKVVQVTVHSPPFFATKFLSQSVNKGEAALLQCEAQGDPVLQVRWFRDRHRLETANHTRYAIKQDLVSAHKVISFLQISPVLRDDSTIYTCLASNPYGTDNTSVQLIVQEPPDPPQTVEVVEVSSRTVQLQWKSPYSGNSPLTRFLIHYRALNCSYMKPGPAALAWNELSTSSGSELRATIKGLMPDCHYQVKMSSENQVGRSQASSSSVTVKTMEEVPGGPPTDVHVETSSSTSIKIRWRPPLAQVQYGRIRGYYIGYRVAGSDEPFQYKNVEGSSDGDESHLSYVTNLRRKTSYVVILQAYNSVGAGPRSDELTVSTFDSQPPTSPVLEVVSSSHEAIVLRWEPAATDAHGQQVREYVLHYQRADAPGPKSDWHQKRVLPDSPDNQVVLSRDNTQGRIRCGTRYRLYMTATNSLGTGEPSETVLARTKGETPVAPSRAQFVTAANGSSAQLALRAWQPRGCPIQAFTIQYKPVQQKQWIPLVEYYEPRRDYFYLSHLSPNRDYQVLVTAHSEAGPTRQEYSFRTPNSSAVVRLTAAPMDPYRLPPEPASGSLHLRNLTVLLPVLISLLVLMVILGTLFGCLRRQHVNHVVNSVQHSVDSAAVATGIGGGLCPQHLAANGYCTNGKPGAAPGLLPGRRECFALAEAHPAVATVGNGTSPRRRVNGGAGGQFATLACTSTLATKKPAEQACYYSSPQRKSAAPHEYAEPVAGSRTLDNHAPVPFL